MKYRGRVKGGVVILDKPNRLSDGTVVQIEPVQPSARRNGTSPAEQRAGTMGALLRDAGTWVGEPAEMTRLLEELRRMKAAEVAAATAELPTPAPRPAAMPRKPSKRKRRS